MTFTDEKTHYSWVYFLKIKDQAFDRFQEWKEMVEKAGGKKLKTLRSEMVVNTHRKCLRPT